MDQNTSSLNEWTGTSEQKLWGLMQIWSEVKFNFVFFDQLPDLDWDAEAQKRIPQVLAAKDMLEYYHILQELVALLNDGHTVVMFSRETRASLDAPPLELQMVEGKIILVRTGDTQEIRAQHIHPGLEIVEIDGCPAREYLQDNVLRYYRGGTKQWGEAMGLFNLLQGPRDTLVSLTVAESDGRICRLDLRRNSELAEGKTFKHRIVDYDPLLETRMLNGIAYFRLSTFDDGRIVKAFNAEMDRLDLDALRGMILDIRFNIGGESGIAFDILSRLTDKPLEAARWKTRRILPAFRAWGEAEEWFESRMSPIPPSPGSHYLGPLMILTGHHTFSSAEDFLVPIVHSQRGILVGEKTAGSTGQPFRVILPGGGYCLICTLQSTFPDGRQFVGGGIEPDVPVALTRKDVCENRDPVLEKAVEMLTRPGNR